MTWKRHTMAATLAAALFAGVAGAQEPAPTPAPSPTPSQGGETAPPPPAAPKAKDSFFGNRFALYLEARGGPASIESISNPTAGAADFETTSEVRLENNKTGEFTIGWTLPRGRGQYLFTFTGIADGNYELDATGYERAYLNTGGGSAQTLSGLAPWWQITIRDGQLRSVQTPPTWNSETDDADDDTFPDNNELQYPTTAFDLQKQVPSSLGTQISTYDLYYRREFGGTRIRARWTAGARYLDVHGALPTPTWIVGQVSNAGVGFTDGVQNGVLVLEQQSSGWGPVGSGEVQFNFFRRRLQLYGLVRAAYLFQKTEADSHVFGYLSRDSDSGDLVVNQGRINAGVSKSTWNTTLELGVRVRIVEGFDLFLGLNRSGYLDTLGVPTRVSFPANSSQVSQGVGSNFSTRDLVVTSLNLGLSFQF